MEVKFLDLSKNIHDIKEEIKQKISNVIDDTSFIMGDQVKNFEINFAKYSGLNSFYWMC